MWETERSAHPNNRRRCRVGVYVFERERGGVCVDECAWQTSGLIASLEEVGREIHQPHHTPHLQHTHAPVILSPSLVSPSRNSGTVLFTRLLVVCWSVCSSSCTVFIHYSSVNIFIIVVHMMHHPAPSPLLYTALFMGHKCSSSLSETGFKVNSRELILSSLHHSPHRGHLCIIGHTPLTHSHTLVSLLCMRTPTGAGRASKL